MINPIANIASIAAPVAAGVASSAAGDFSNFLSNALGGIQSAQSSASDAVQKFMSGENEELHTTILAAQKAELSFELGMQVRNKVVDAYQEVMKMQM